MECSDKKFKEERRTKDGMRNRKVQGYSEG
jgi:hypothetical protein